MRGRALDFLTIHRCSLNILHISPEMFDILPIAVVTDLLSSWLTPSCVGRLDSAFCVHDQRSQLLSYLQGSSFGNKLPISQYYDSDVFFEWIWRRNIKLQVAELSLHRNLINNWKLRCDLLGLTGTGLNKVTFVAGMNDDATFLVRAVTDVAMHCTNLKECNFNRYNDTIVATLLARNPNMERVFLQNCNSYHEPEILHLIGNFCPHILAIDLRSNLGDHAFKRFLAAIPCTLQSLCLPNCARFTWTTLIDVLQQCSDLHELRVGFIGSMNNKLPLDLTGTGFTGMRTFRADFEQFNEQTITVLSKLMPNLTTLILLTTRMGYSRPEDYCAFLELILKKFLYLRQLVFALPYEEKLRPLPCFVFVVHDGEEDVKPLPLPGSLLEELYVTHPVECLSIVPLPALRTLGCRNSTTRLKLPPQLTRVVLDRHARSENCELFLLQLTGLEEIDVVFSHGLSNHGMRRMAIQNPHLRVLRLEQTQLDTHPAISAEGLLIFLRNCPLLHTVVYTVSHGARKTEGAVPSCALLLKALRATFPNLKDLFYTIDVSS